MKITRILAASLMCSVILSAQTKETAVLFSGGSSMDESYLLTEDVSVSFKNGTGTIMVGEISKGTLDLDKGEVTAEFKDAFRLTANQDPAHQDNYYATFSSCECAYRLPEDGSAKAYAGTVGGGQLNMTDIGGIIHKGEPVVLRATGNGTDSNVSLTLMPSCNSNAASTPNELLGTDVDKTLGADDYALSFCQEGVGFYQWDGKMLHANKAYLTLSKALAKAFTFMFDDGATTAIEPPIPNVQNPTGAYNLNGVSVDDNYQGVVIKDGKIIYQQ